MVLLYSDSFGRKMVSIQGTHHRQFDENSGIIE